MEMLIANDPFLMKHLGLFATSKFLLKDFTNKNVSGVTGKYGYVSEGDACFISAKSGSGLVPLFRYYNGFEHFYTSNSAEIGTTTSGVVGNYGYRSEGIAGYCYGAPTTGTIPFHRYWNGKEHFYTTDVKEIGTTTSGAVGKYNYKYEGVACYVKPGFFK